MYGPKHIITRHWRLILFFVIVVVVAWVFYVLRSILFPFLFGLLVAYILLPLVAWIQARLPQDERWLPFNRIIAITIIYVLFLLAVGLFLFYLSTTIFNAVSSLVGNADTIIASATATVQEWTRAFLDRIPQSLRQQVSQYLNEAGTQLTDTIKNIVMMGLAFIPSSIGLVVGLASLPLFLFYVLYDWETMRDEFYGIFSQTIAEHLRNVILIIGNMMRQYFRGQLVLSVIVGLLDFAGLSLLGISFAPALGFLGAVGEFIPVFGPWLNGIIGSLVTLAVAPGRLVWVIALYAIVQLLENIFLVPRIQGNQMRIHPAIVLVLIVVGTHLAGFWGTILVLPVAATIVRVYEYVRHVTAMQDAREKIRQI